MMPRRSGSSVHTSRGRRDRESQTDYRKPLILPETPFFIPASLLSRDTSGIPQVPHGACLGGHAEPMSDTIAQPPYARHPFDEEDLRDIEPVEARSIYELIGRGYERFWYWQGRYRVLMGSRGSKKSMTTAYWYILHMMEMPLANLLVVRMIADTNRDSTYATLLKVIHLLGVQDHWAWSKAPLEITYKPTGQKIIFRGLDDPYKLSSIDVPKGVLCWAWFEEAYQITSEEMFDKVDQSIRGQMPPGYFPQITLTFNPWNQNHWLKKRFFDTPRPGVLAMRTNYRINEFLSDHDKQFFENMRVQNPRMYQVAGLGNWGVSEGLIYTDWEIRDFDMDEIRKRQSVRMIWGLDFGYSQDPTALVASAVDLKERTIYVYDEWFALRQTNRMIADVIRERGWGRERIVCDSASPQNIGELQLEQNIDAVASPKGKDSVENGIQLVQQYHIVIAPKCVNIIREIESYSYDQDKLGNILSTPIDDWNHGLDALRYSLVYMLFREGGGFYGEIKGDDLYDPRRADDADGFLGGGGGYVFST